MCDGFLLSQKRRGACHSVLASIHESNSNLCKRTPIIKPCYTTKSTLVTLIIRMPFLSLDYNDPDLLYFDSKKNQMSSPSLEQIYNNGIKDFREWHIAHLVRKNNILQHELNMQQKLLDELPVIDPIRLSSILNQRSHSELVYEEQEFQNDRIQWDQKNCCHSMIECQPPSHSDKERATTTYKKQQKAEYESAGSTNVPAARTSTAHKQFIFVSQSIMSNTEDICMIPVRNAHQKKYYPYDHMTCKFSKLK
jgi:hypothetical protein